MNEPRDTISHARECPDCGAGMDTEVLEAERNGAEVIACFSCQKSLTLWQSWQHAMLREIKKLGECAWNERRFKDLDFYLAVGRSLGSLFQIATLAERLDDDSEDHEAWDQLYAYLQEHGPIALKATTNGQPGKEGTDATA